MTLGVLQQPSDNREEDHTSPELHQPSDERYDCPEDDSAVDGHKPSGDCAKRAEGVEGDSSAQLDQASSRSDEDYATELAALHAGRDARDPDFIFDVFDANTTRIDFIILDHDDS